MANLKSFASIIILALSVLIATPLRAGVPTEQIRTTAKKILDFLNDPQRKSEAKKEDRRDLLRRTIKPRFNFTEMAKRSLGAHWCRWTPCERKEFIRLSTDLLQHTYIGGITHMNDKKFDYLSKNLYENYAVLKTRVAATGGGAFSINYKAHLVYGDWKVYDIVAETISVVNNYRSQFNRNIRKSFS
jgi:phospholipid transport system substrate-binding protein